MGLLSLLMLDDQEPIECVVFCDEQQLRERLEQAVAEQAASWFRPGFRLRWRGSESFTLSYLNGRNSFQRSFHATLLRAEGQLAVSGCFKLNPFVRAFTLIWLAMTAVLSVVFLTAEPSVAVFTLILPLAGLVIPRLGRWRSKPDEGKVLELLARSCS